MATTGIGLDTSENHISLATADCLDANLPASKLGTETKYFLHLESSLLLAVAQKSLKSLTRSLPVFEGSISRFWRSDNGAQAARAARKMGAKRVNFILIRN